MKSLLASLPFWFTSLFFTVAAEPWVDTRNLQLKADIEYLADRGIIQVPISSYPLIWSGIVKDLDNFDINGVPRDYKSTYWRVKKAAKQALRKDAHFQVSLTAANQANGLHRFGDTAREEFEISTRRLQMNKHFAWNMEITRVSDPQDGKKLRFDGSYLAVVTGNWIVSLGAVDKWWGSSWDSSGILSNNARPPLSLTLQRNYSQAFDIPILNKLGPWSLTSFIGQLDNDQSMPQNSYTAGVSFTFKPHWSLELGLRSTSIWGGDEQLDVTEALVENILPIDQCSSSNNSNICHNDGDNAGENYRLSGVDFRWRLPLSHPLSIYASAYGQESTGFIADNSIKQYGITTHFEAVNVKWRSYLEYSDTQLGNLFNQAYESPKFNSGYRYFNRSIGSTYDNDSQAVSLGVLAGLDKYNDVKFKLTQAQLNQDNSNVNSLAHHSVSPEAKDITQLSLEWTTRTQKYGEFDIKLSYVDQPIESIDSGASVSWTYSIE